MSFGSGNFKIIRGMLKGKLLDFLGMYAYNIATLPGAIPTVERDGWHDSLIPDTPAFHDDLAMKNLLFYLSSDIERYLGIDLIPSYSYLRVYKRGDVLYKHKDKNSCEFSVTLTLNREFEEDIWPIYLETNDGAMIYPPVKIELDVGDGLIYKGAEHPHWRDEFEGSRLAQVFLHYVKGK